MSDEETPEGILDPEATGPAPAPPLPPEPVAPDEFTPLSNAGRRSRKPSGPFVWLIDIGIGALVALLVVFVIGKIRQDDSPSKNQTNTGTFQTTKRYSARIETTLGTIVVALDQSTPKGTGNFVTLARKGFYNGLTFHRVVTNFVVQAGDPAGNGSGGPGYSIAAEPPTTPYSLGDVAYAKTSSLKILQFW